MKDARVKILFQQNDKNIKKAKCDLFFLHKKKRLHHLGNVFFYLFFFYTGNYLKKII